MCGHATHEATADIDVSADTFTLEFAHELADAYLSAAITGISSDRAAAVAGATSPKLAAAALRTAKVRIHRAISLFSWIYGPMSSPVMVRVSGDPTPARPARVNSLRFASQSVCIAIIRSRCARVRVCTGVCARA
jgi:hypothetical protein